MTGVFLSKEPDLGIPQALISNLRDFSSKATTEMIGTHDPGARVVCRWIHVPSQSIDHRRRPRWCRTIMARIKLVKEDGQETIRLVAFGDQEPVQRGREIVVDQRKSKLAPDLSQRILCPMIVVDDRIT